MTHLHICFMEKLKKIMITPYFGQFPEWMAKYEPPIGYDWLLDTDLDKFKKRVKDKLGIDCPIVAGTGKVWDYRCALGLLYEEEIKGFDYWGFTDFDCVYGDVDKWFTDEQLSELDVWSNHHSYVCGCWSLLKNSDEVNRLFMRYDNWKEMMIYPEANGWVEQEYSRLLEQSRLKYKYSFFQGNPYNPPFNLKKEDGKLFQDGEEVAMFHFRRSKKFPL
jgi:hypothetical protein